jgi:transcriptional regulator with XRE-family HTH domain
MSEPSEVLRILKLLERLIAYQKVPISTIEEKLGVSQGYVARILGGRTHLRFQHVLDILAAIGVSPKRFFTLAYSDEDDDMMGELRALASKPALPDAGGALMTVREGDLEKLVIKTLTKLDLLPVASPSRSKPPRTKRKRS